MAECPDETTLVDFLEGRLSEERRGGVISHLEGCADCQWLLAMGNGALPTDGSAGTSGEQEAAPLARGARLSRYAVLEQLGAGAMGVVYAAYDPELDRQVALKVLRPEGRHVAELQRRLLLEAQALARLSHPHVVTVYDAGTDGERIFLAMELVEGATLADWLKTPRAWHEVLRVFREAGQGLAAAHAAGLVHRDFKPANVLVGKDGRARVTDFGMARPTNRVRRPAEEMSLGAATSTLSPLTRTGVLLGTPAYMAPELLQGHRADALSDQFSFCVALHEALFGVRPFAGDSLEEIVHAAAEGRIQPPLRDAKVPARVRRAVLRGLKAQPEERFASMEALLTALVSSSRRASMWAAAALVAVLLGVAAVYGLAWRRETRCAQEVAKLGPAWGPERRERVHAAFLATGAPYAALAWEKLSAVLDAHAAQWRTLRTEACLATDRDMTTEAWQVEACLDARVWQFVAVVEVLEKADARTVQRASQLAASLEGLSGCRDASPASARPQPPDALRARVDEARRKLAQAQASLEGARYAEGLQVTTALLADIRGLGFQPLDAEVLLTHGKLLANTDKLKEAEDSLYKAVWAAEAVHDDETAARAWIFVLWVVGDPMARPADAERIAQHAQAALQRLGPERFPSVAMDLNLYLSAVLIQQRKLDRAEAEITQGLSLARRTYGDDDLRTARFLHALGRVRYRQYRTEEALALNLQALAVRERLLGPAHPDLIHSLNNLANVYNMMGHVDEALAQLHRVIAIQEAAAPVDEASLSETLHNLGRTQRLAGQIDKARESLKRALPLLERLYGHDHPRVASNISVMALVEFDANHLDEALALATDALERTRRALGPETVRAEAPLQYRARIHLKAGRLREARRDFEEALTLLAKEQGPDGPGTSGIYINMSGVDMEEGKPRDALNRCQRALALDEKAQGPDAQIVAVELCCIAEAKLALGAADEAEPLLERARNIHQLRSGEYVNAAWTSFLLARALWEKRVAPDRARAAALAQEARTKLEALGLKGNAELAKVIAWQRARGLI